MVKKRQAKQTPIQILDERLQKMMKTRLQAHISGASGDLMMQIDMMIAEVNLDLFTETEKERFRNMDKDDGEQWIV
jgi:hypothetical protein